jgi:pyrimidine-nucleoside phosphorylase
MSTKIVRKKKQGQELTQEEINSIINEYYTGTLSEDLMKDFLIAVKDKGMSIDETVHLTQAMVNTGERIDWKGTRVEDNIKIDQPSTGGVGNKSPLIVPPIVACAGIIIPKMSTRGSVSGTIDILESIGYVAAISTNEFIKNVEDYGFSNICQTKDLAPVDERIMGLRRETKTMKQTSLVVSSILSKKIAVGCDRVVVDVKAGPKSKFGDYTETLKGAQRLVEVGSRLGIKVVSVVTNNIQPQGVYIGNSLSLVEVLEVLSGNGPVDQREICIYLASRMFLLSDRVCSVEEGKKLALDFIKSGKALEKFRQQLRVHRADLKKIDNSSLLQDAEYKIPLISDEEGFIEKVDVNKIDECSELLISKYNKVFHYNTGIVLSKKVGDYVTKGEVLAVIHSNDHQVLDEARDILLLAFKLSKDKSEKKPNILACIDETGLHTF